MTHLTPRNIYRPATCTCGANFLSNTAWDNGQLVMLDSLCGDCAGQPVLFGGAE